MPKHFLLFFRNLFQRVHDFPALVETAMGASAVGNLFLAAFRAGLGLHRFDRETAAFGITSLLGVSLFWY
jgi:hypothetical protein